MRSRLACVLLGLACFSSGYAQQNIDKPAETEDLQRRVQQLEAEVAELKQVVRQLQSSIPAAPVNSAFPGGPAHETADPTPLAPASLAAPGTGPVPCGEEETAHSSVATASQPSSLVRQQATASGQQQTASAFATSLSAEDRWTLDFLRETTVNLYLDTYYDYNFNAPVGRVNLLRAYDVLSNNFSLNQAAVIFDREPDPGQGHRWGGRLDLHFGQATDTLQGNPNNEPRPDIYRNVFQAYGTYVAPVGKGLTLDFGKWASSLGIEGNYTKDQMNYSRSLWFARTSRW